MKDNMKRIFGNGRYANVTATLALVVALGGTSYAAAKLAPNSVGAAQLKRNAVTTAKVKDGTLQAADFQAGTITPGKDGPRGPQGAAGPAGAPGAKGDKGDTGDPCLSSDPACRGPNGAAGFSAISTSALAFPASTASTTVQSLDLPAGKYIVDARVNAHDTGADSTVACSLASGATTIDSMGGALGVDTTATIDAALSLNGPLTLGAPGTVKLNCSLASVVPGNYSPRSITAIQVGTINGA
jgi:hypothetical protein